MELIMIWAMVKRRWWLIALPALVALVVTLPSLGDVVSPDVSYFAQMRLTAAAPPDAAIPGVTTPYEDTVYVPLLASEYVVVNLPHWIGSDRFADEVSQALGAQSVEIPAADLSGAFIADSFRSILTLYVVWDDPDEIRPIAEAAVTVLQTRNQTYFPQFAAAPVTVVPLDDPDVNTLAPSITTRIGPLLRIFVGLAAGVGLAALAEYLDASIRAREDLETLGLTVLAEIPRE